jgi:hypothetical protein
LQKSLVRRLQQPLSLRLDGLITFATRRPQPFSDCAGRLQRMGDDRNRVALRILVVDDDPHLAIRAWLKRYGFKVSIADGGTMGITALGNSTFD